MTIKKNSVKAFFSLIIISCIIALGFYLKDSNKFAAELIPIQEPTVPICGARKVSDTTITSLVKPTNAAIKVIDNTVDNSGITDFHFFYTSSEGENKLYLKSGLEMRIYNPLTYELIKKFTFSNTSLTGGFTLDPQGNIYLTHVTSGLYKFDSSGNQIWNVKPGIIDNEPYGYNTANGFRIGAVIRGKNGSKTYDIDGNQKEDNLVYGSIIHVSKNTGEIVATGGGYVRVYAQDGQSMRIHFGTNLGAHDPGPMHFYILGGADILSDGSIAVVDSGRGLRLFDSGGIYLGMAKDGGPLDDGVTGLFTDSSPMEWYNGKLFYRTGAPFRSPSHLTYMSEANLKAFVEYPQGAPFGLGIGAGPFTKVKGNYFPAGTEPQVYLQFFPWWSIHAQNGNLRGEYTIRDIKQIKKNQKVDPQKFTIPASEIISDVDLQLPSTQPGFYELDVKLYKDNQVVGADCLNYSIGSSQMSLDLNQLSGESNTAEIRLTYELGLKLLRGRFQLENYLPQDANSTDLLNFSTIEADIKAAGELADQLGVTFELQMAAGGTKEKAIVNNGRWQARVQETTAHFKGYVHAWEAWNEPNGGYYGNATDFTNKVLKPFYLGVRAGDPEAIVVGGGIIGNSTGYWDEIARNGGLDYMDAAGIHPYVGHNRSFEEQGSVDALKNLKKFFSDKGKPNMPIWDTESGFWDKGTNSYYNQGDKIIRKIVLENSLGIENYAYFFINGGYIVDGLFGGIYTGKLLKPAGLSMLNLKANLGGRKFESWIDTNIPHTYAALYGNKIGSEQKDKVLVIWAEDFTLKSQIEVPSLDRATVTDNWGMSRQINTVGGKFDLEIDGSPQYIRVPDNIIPSIKATEDFGANLSLASQGATATATSSLSPNLPAKAIDGIMNTQNKGGNTEGISVWIQNPTDGDPELTIDLGQEREINRILVSSQGIASVQTGLRNYDVKIKNTESDWKVVASVRNDFFARNHLLSFPAQKATHIKIANMAVNYSGYNGGIKPSFWPSAKNDVWIGQTTIYEVEAYSPGIVHSLEPKSDSVMEIDLTRFSTGINMVSFPLIKEELFTDFLSTSSYDPGIDFSVKTESGNGKSKIISYVNEAYVRYSSTQQNVKPELGKGYFMRVFENDSLANIKYQRQEADSVSIAVNTGWNLIGNPFATNLSPINFKIKLKNGQIVSFQDAVNKKIVIGYQYSWDRALNAYKFISPFSSKYSNQSNYRSYIEPWRGFWFYVISPEVDQIIQVK